MILTKVLQVTVTVLFLSFSLFMLHIFFYNHVLRLPRRLYLSSFVIILPVIDEKFVIFVQNHKSKPLESHNSIRSP